MRCRICGKNKPVSQFQEITSRGKVYIRKKCHQCRYTEDCNRKRKIRKEIQEYKKKHSCIKCGYSDFRALEFHHKNRADKTIDIADAVGHGWSLEHVMKEVEKCDVLCANCHAILHFEEKV